jgi:hypothetical protein
MPDPYNAQAFACAFSYGTGFFKENCSRLREQFRLQISLTDIS